MLSESRIEQERVGFEQDMIERVGLHAQYRFSMDEDGHFADPFIESRFEGWLAAIEVQEKAPTESGIEERDRLCKQYNDDKISLSALVELLWGAAYVQGDSNRICHLCYHDKSESSTCCGADCEAQEITLPEPILENDLGYNSYSAGHDDGQKHYYKMAIESLEQQGLVVKV